MIQIPEELLAEVQDAFLNNEIPFSHVTLMLENGTILNSFSLERGWENGFLELRFSPQGFITANLTWTISSDD